MKRVLFMTGAFRTFIGVAVTAVIATAVSVAPYAATAQTAGPSDAALAPPGGTLGPEACKALQTAMADASELTAASMANLQEYRKRLGALIGELEKDLAEAGADERTARLEKVRNLHEQMSGLSVQEDEVLRQEGRLSTSRAELHRLCPPAGERRQGTPDSR